jgi:hypothetical protein
MLLRPNGVTLIKTADFTSDGTDGKIRYVVVAGDLNADGRWRIQGKIIIPSGTFSTEIGTFMVHANL